MTRREQVYKKALEIIAKNHGRHPAELTAIAVTALEDAKHEPEETVTVKIEADQFFIRDGSERDKPDIIQDGVIRIPENSSPFYVAPFATEGYHELARILADAFNDAASGKGKARHANNLPWHEQPIITIGNFTGPGGTAFQAIKKIREALDMSRRNENSAAIREIHGAIVYAAATIYLVEARGK
ncbi:hypothetical protein HMSP1_54 [Sinorhizobium phage HMSP1-Susan]|nr:hypothetical protein HMSP1_54 [Sinorhizobium phage HMSP1-Susan]